ncbi:unnamed protein product [Somion occarium]|uniref:DUF803-domain-containing protein n=1 Tax=Somion occarium TaxID=3059160 RepID=A0ABP1DDD5_9APHY
MSSTTSPSPTSSVSAAATTSAAATLKAPGNLKVVGIILAIVSGVLIGSSFVFKKKGLLRSQGVAGEGVAYLKSALWWTGMIMMILGELCNFAAYAFVEAIVVTPMGALSVVVSAILSHFILKEQLSFFGWLGCGLCIIGSVIIALNGPEESSIGQIREFQKLFLAPGFLVYGSILIATSLVIAIYFAPRYGKKSMLWYISVCSMIGGISVSVTTGLGSAIVTTAMGDNQFKYWFIYFLMVFIAVTLITEVYYLNVALALFNTVTPTYYVIFTFFSILTTIVLFKGLKAPVNQIITLVMGFIVICFGITILQLSKVDPTEIKALDRKSTILLQAARRNTEGMDEKSLMAVEDPGMDTLRGSFGTIGSIMRAKSAKRMSMSSARAPSSIRSRRARDSDLEHPLPPIPQHLSGMSNFSVSNTGGDALFPGMKRHQLYDPPVQHPGDAALERMSTTSHASQMGSPKKQTIKFDSQDMVHSYRMPGTGDNSATHLPRSALSQAYPSTPYTPLEASGPELTMTPSEELDEEAALRSAPPMLDSVYRPLSIDPFAPQPRTATMGSFPSISSTAPSSSTESPTSTRRLISSGRSKASSPPHHHTLFGRSTSERERHYPRGDKEEDKEESESLWHHGGEEDVESVRDVEARTSIRLVPNSGNRI